MRNAEVKTMQVAGSEALVALLGKARLEEKKDQHWSFAQRLVALALHAQQKEFSAAEVIELLRKEAEPLRTIVAGHNRMIRPFIKWAGGKTRALPDLLPHLPKGDVLIEPFVGGASVFLNTDFRHYVLADINADLINMYSVAKNQTDDFLDVVLLMFKNGNSKEAYLETRELFNWANRNETRLSYSSSFKLLQAARFLYLNRHGYNGMCRYNKNGEFNIPHGKYKTQYLPFVEIKQFAEKANDTKALFVVADFCETLTSQAISESSVIYCDPPYLPASDTANFTQYHHAAFTIDHHRDLAAQLLNVNRSRGVPVVISNSDTPATREIYQHYQFHEIAVQRSISANGITRGAAKEVIGVLGGSDD